MLESENRKPSLGAISLSALGMPATTYFELRHHGEAEAMWNPRFVVKQLTSVATSHRGEISLAMSEAKIPWRDIDLSASQPVITYQSRRKVSTTGCGTPSHHSSDRAALLISFVFKVRRPSSCIITTPL